MYIFFRLAAALKCNVKFLVIYLHSNDKQLCRRQHLCPSPRPSSLIAANLSLESQTSCFRHCQLFGTHHQAQLSQLKTKGKKLSLSRGKNDVKIILSFVLNSQVILVCTAVVSPAPPAGILRVIFIKQAALGRKQCVSCTFHMALRGHGGQGLLLRTTNRLHVFTAEPYFSFIRFPVV